ncbi:endolytic transglycosylase MltG [candidate division GN15 bacterium]|uniref:Endolytic murein transglycosylase n=1 Tax=candidate division GN15 bacterium TaxID=2072418 RepID=A0A855X9H2_9BACT|nr:MAG: endolytic transglycosylase MltG [candidate division GN15 bacterium]
MKPGTSKPKVSWWEYPWYAFVTIFLLLVGMVLFVGGLMVAVLRLFRRPVVSWRLAFVVLPLLVICGAAYLYFLYSSPINIGSRTVPLTVSAGDRFQTVSRKLYDEGVIRSDRLLNFLAKVKHIDRKLIPGEYSFTGRNSVRSVLHKLEIAEGAQVRVTVVEGSPIWRVASVVAQQLKADSAQFMALAKDKRFLDSVGIPSLEGYLFPETYFLAPGTDARTAAAEMVQMFMLKTHNLWANLPATGMTRDQIVILASIVQAESKRPEEDGKIASVYANRLRLGMALDADPTVIYGLGGLDRPLTRNDLEQVTPYNTYRNPGLPPTPINSPGLAALEAAARPDSTGYLFFVADGTGAHIFSYTNDEHNMARRHVKMMEKRR